MSVTWARQRAALLACLVTLTGCGARVSLGDYLDDTAGGSDAEAPSLDASPPFFDAETFDVEVDGPADASDEGFDDGPSDADASAADAD